MKSMYRIGGLLLVALTLGACHRKGDNIPLDEARVRLNEPLVEQHIRISPPIPEDFPGEAIMVAGSRWRSGFDSFTLPANAVTPVATAAGLSFFALAWNTPPYDRLLVPEPGRPGQYREFLPIF